MNTNGKHIYLIGIGGIGMSALARYYHLKGYNVSGYDLTQTPLTDNLQKEGINIHYLEDISQIPENPELVIYTPAIPKDNKELIYCFDKKYNIKKRAEVLGIISEDYKTIAVSGTHGKTTTTCMITHLLNNSTIGCNAFLGGILKNIDSNYLFNKNSNYLVAEADEYDRSFLKLKPTFCVITSVEPDHLDIFGTAAMHKEAYTEFTENIRENGILLSKKNNGLKHNCRNNVKVYEYSITERTDFYADNIRLIDGLYIFDFHTPEKSIAQLNLSMPGLHNVENAVAALSIAYLAGLTENELKENIKTFNGVERRFDVRYKNDKILYIDDYAHHPDEIKAFINSLKQIYNSKKITLIFQPHLYTRTRDFMNEFAETLSLSDNLILLPIYPAREKPIEGISSDALLEKVNMKNKSIVLKKDLLNHIKNIDFEILATVGAGDISNFVKPIVEILKQSKK